MEPNSSAPRINKKKVTRMSPISFSSPKSLVWIAALPVAALATYVTWLVVPAVLRVVVPAVVETVVGK